MHVCDYLLACDMEMDPVPGYAFTSWEKGYGDVLLQGRLGDPAPRELARAAAAIVLCDVFDEKRERAGRDRAALASCAASCSARASAASCAHGRLGARVLRLQARPSRARARRATTDLATYGQYVEDYHILQGTKTEPLVGAIRRHLDASGMPVEFSKGEWGPGQQEINLRYCELLEMADRHVALQERGARRSPTRSGLAITFMAKWDAQMAGNSMHVTRASGTPQRATRTASRATSRCRAARCARRRRSATGSAGCSRTRARSRSSSRPP